MSDKTATESQWTPVDESAPVTLDMSTAKPLPVTIDMSTAKPLESQWTPVDEPGQVTNDVGQQVVVPKDGESFADTLKRGAALGKARQKAGTQQAAIDAEMATAPKKAAQTLGAAATIGAVGPALLAAPGELADIAIKHLAGNVLPGLETQAAKQTLMQALPKVAEFASTMSKLGIGAAGLTYLFKAITGSK